MLLNVVPSDSIHEVVLPDLLISNSEIVGGIIDRGFPLLYILGHGDKRIVVSARSYHENNNTALLPQEIIKLLGLDQVRATVKCSRFIDHLPTLKGLVVKPLNTDFYRSQDIRTLIELKLMNVSIMHRGLRFNVEEGNRTHELEIQDLVTDSVNQEDSAMIRADQEILLDFAPNDPLYEIFKKEQSVPSRLESLENLCLLHRENKQLFGLSGVLIDYIRNFKQPASQNKPSEFTGRGRTFA